MYDEAAARVGPSAATVDPVAYARLLDAWADVARAMPELVGWLTEWHLRDAIDGFSVETSQEILAADGRLSAESASVIVRHDVERRTSVPLTDELRARIQAAVDADLAARGSGAPR